MVEFIFQCIFFPLFLQPQAVQTSWLGFERWKHVSGQGTVPMVRIFLPCEKPTDRRGAFTTGTILPC